MRRLPATLLLCALASACGADSGAASNAAGGTIVISTAADADILLPALSNLQQAQVIVQNIFDRLAEPGDGLNTVGDEGFRPHLARRWTWSADSLSIAFDLDPRARWHDGQPVTARDVRFTWELYVDPLTAAPFGPLLANIDSVTARDSLTAVFWFKRRYPEQFFDATYQMLIHPEHLLRGIPRDQLRAAPFGRAPVGSGRFRFVRWDAGARIEIASDTLNYAGRARLDRVIWTIAPDPNAAANRVFTRDADFYENARPDNIAELAGHPELKLVPYPSLQYGFIQFAFRENGTARPHPLFADVRMRRAILLALDRQKMLRNVFDSLAVVPLGPVPHAVATFSLAAGEPDVDLAGANALLDSLGWMRGPDGMRKKGATPLRFSLMIPSSSRTRIRYSVLVQEQLRAAGIHVDVEQLEPTAMADRMSKRTFDAAISTIGTDPSPATIRQNWGGAGAVVKDGPNHSGYASAAFDALVDSASSARTLAASHDYFRRAYRVINDDIPAIWLYEPRIASIAHTRLQLTRLRADAWWAGLADWSIPPGQRIARDRIGAGAIAK
jgi:peptide/nickel transport system substrate-binding protein